LPRPLRIEFAQEPTRAGTGGALFHARDRLDERFLLCNGDSLFSIIWPQIRRLKNIAAVEPKKIIPHAQDSRKMESQLTMATIPKESTI